MVWLPICLTAGQVRIPLSSIRILVTSLHRIQPLYLTVLMESSMQVNHALRYVPIRRIQFRQRVRHIYLVMITFVLFVEKKEISLTIRP